MLYARDLSMDFEMASDLVQSLLLTATLTISGEERRTC